MRPLTAAAAGLVLVVVDLRLEELDVLPDVLGWALIALALHRLADARGAALAVVGAVASLGELHLPSHVRIVESAATNPQTGDTIVMPVEVLEYDQVTGMRLVAVAVATAALVVVVVRLLVLLGQRAARHGAAGDLRAPRAAGAAAAALWALPRLVAVAIAAVGDDGYDPVWNGRAWSLAFLGGAAGVAAAASLLPIAREPWALPPGRALRTGAWQRTDPAGP